MKRLNTALLAVGLMMALAIPASAAELHEPHQGTMCEFGFKQLHFVHNQHAGQGDWSDTIVITLQTEDGTNTYVSGSLGATKVNRGTVHYTIEVGPELSLWNVLVTAEDTIGPGNLVLSDYTCRTDGDSGSGGGDPYAN